MLRVVRRRFVPYSQSCLRNASLGCSTGNNQNRNCAYADGLHRHRALKLNQGRLAGMGEWELVTMDVTAV